MKKVVTSSLVILSIISISFAQRSTHYQGVDIYCNNGSSVTKSQNIATDASDRIGVWGISLPQAYYGIGLQGEGGFVGVRGISGLSGSGTRTGVWGAADGGETANYGVYGTAYGTNAWAGYFDGNVYCTGTYQSSDLLLKKNVEDLSGALSKIMKLKPKTYEYDNGDKVGLNLPGGKKIGLIAQDVEKILPEIVAEVPINKINKDGVSKESNKNETFKAVNYTELIPVLINAIQEQQKEIEKLKEMIR